MLYEMPDPYRMFNRHGKAFVADYLPEGVSVVDVSNLKASHWPVSCRDASLHDSGVRCVPVARVERLLGAARLLREAHRLVKRRDHGCARRGPVRPAVQGERREVVAARVPIHGSARQANRPGCRGRSNSGFTSCTISDAATPTMSRTTIPPRGTVSS